MEFPITKERLQNYRENEFITAERNQRINEELKTIYKEVERIIINTYESKYVYRMPYHVIRPNMRMSGGQSHVQPNQAPLPQPTSILEELLQAVKDAFPDSNIILDPLETYILIDWS